MRSTLIHALALSTAAMSGTSFAQVTSQIVAAASRPAPGGAFIPTAVYAPQIDNTGNVLFGANTNVALSAIIYGNPQTLSFVIKSDDPAPGLPGRTMVGVGSQRLSIRGGKIAFAGTTAGGGVTGANDDASWVGTIGGFLRPYYTEQPTLCCERRPNCVNQLGQTIFSRIESGFNTSNTRFDTTNVQTPIVGAGGVPYTFYPGDGSLNAGGGSAWASSVNHPFFGGYVNASVGYFSGTGTATIATASLDALALLGNGYAATWFVSSLGDVGHPVNDQGQLVFAAERWFGDGTVRSRGELNKWSPSEGVTTLLRDGDAIPGGGTFDFGLFTTLATTRINGNGNAVFIAATGPRPRVFGDQFPGFGIFVIDWNGAVTRVATQGAPLPGLPSVTLGTRPEQMFFNARNEVAFLVSVLDGTALVLGRPSLSGYTFELVARSGQLVEVAPGNVQVIGTLSLATGSSGNQDGNGTALNDLGQLAYAAAFRNFGGSAVFVTQALAPVCDPIDFNQNSLFPEDQDLIDFLSVLAGGPCSPGNTCNDIDFNNDGLFPSDDDLVAFLRVLAGGSCN